MKWILLILRVGFFPLRGREEKGEAGEPGEEVKIVAVDLQAMAPLPGVTQIQGDITKVRGGESESPSPLQEPNEICTVVGSSSMSAVGIPQEAILNPNRDAFRVPVFLSGGSMETLKSSSGLAAD